MIIYYNILLYLTITNSGTYSFYIRKFYDKKNIYIGIYIFFLTLTTNLSLIIYNIFMRMFYTHIYSDV